MIRRLLSGALLALALYPPLFLAGIAAAGDAAPQSVAGQLLVAAPKLTDPNFDHAVIYIVAHDGNGAFGLVINRPYGEGSLAALLEAFGLNANAGTGDVRIYYGGPVEVFRGFVLHSRDYTGASTIPVGPHLALSTGRDVLEALAAGTGPARKVVLLGYAGWAPGQLDSEIARDDWLIAPAEDALIFADDPAATWERVLKQAGLPM